MSLIRLYMVVIFLCAMFNYWVPEAFAQEPNNAPAKDSIVFDEGSASQAPIFSDKGGSPELIQSKAKEYVPRKAGLYSAVLPGLGQAYNKKYWKIPLVYGGFFSLGLVVNFWNGEYNKFRNLLYTEILVETKPVPSSGFSETAIRSRIQQSRRERDFYIILTGVLYLLNIADAHIDAHLKEFDLNEDLKVRLQPKLSTTPWGQPSTGLALTLNFK